MLGQELIQSFRFGSQNWATEHSAAGDLLWAASYPENVQAYRVVRSSWTGQPRTDPSIYVASSSENNTIETFISWNGDSRVESWRVYASQDNTTSSNATEFAKAGFETVYSFQVDWPEGANSMYVWAEGVSGDQVVGTTRQVTLSREGSGGSVSEQTGVGSGSNSTSSNDGGSGSSSGSDSGSSGSGSSDANAEDDANGSLATFSLSGGGCLAIIVGALASAFLM